MELKYLEYFVTCARTNSFSKAADILYVNQSSISRAIQALEEEWGTTLFLRSKRGAFLTIEGEEYYEKVVQILKDVDALGHENSLLKYRYFTVGTYPSNYINYIFSELCKKNKDDRTIFRILSRNASEILSMLAKHLVDVGIIYTSEMQFGKLYRTLQKENLEFVPITRATPCIYIGHKNEPEGKKGWTLEELKKKRFFKTHYDFREGYHDLVNTITKNGLLESIEKGSVVDDGYGILNMLNNTDYCYLGHLLLSDKDEIIRIDNIEKIYENYRIIDSYDGDITMGYVVRKDEPVSPFLGEFLDLIDMYIK